MTALAEALLAAQRQAIGALSKAYVAGAFEDDGESGLIENLNRIGCTDAVDQSQLRESLDVLRTYGAPAPRATQAEPKSAEHEPATERQLDYMSDLANERGVTQLPDYSLTKASASKLIEQLKAGTYNPDEWTVPF